eukprot:TRINITY_DN4166_c0_g1_i1.p1 TRINITY_DN4166_c0_g1~~TRINITY_DN4166_c0_g1_i1.p1  ORF type:complete len:642 (-),score=67.85 TRINITY_DN4166_c0_g1_i1:401-2326(-)
MESESDSAKFLQVSNGEMPVWAEEDGCSEGAAPYVHRPWQWRAFVGGLMVLTLLTSVIFFACKAQRKGDIDSSGASSYDPNTIQLFQGSSFGTCTCFGDPHCKGFTGGQFNFHEIGEYSFLTSSTMDINVFTCPWTTTWLGTASNVGVALRINDYTVEIWDNFVYVNGKQCSGSKRFGGGILEVDLSAGLFTIYGPPSIGGQRPKVEVQRMANAEASGMPTGYWMQVTANVQVDAGAGGLCAGPDGGATGVTISQSFFSSNALTWLEGKCDGGGKPPPQPLPTQPPLPRPTGNCAPQCATCNNNGNPGICQHWCSTGNFCGIGPPWRHYDCRGCGGSPPPNPPPTHTGCSEKCHSCMWDRGGACTQYCSQYNYCGDTDAYIQGGTDCRSCQSPTPPALPDPDPSCDLDEDSCQACAIFGQSFREAAKKCKIVPQAGRRLRSDMNFAGCTFDYCSTGKDEVITGTINIANLLVINQWDYVATIDLSLIVQVLSKITVETLITQQTFIHVIETSIMSVLKIKSSFLKVTLQQVQGCTCKTQKIIVSVAVKCTSKSRNIRTAKALKGNAFRIQFVQKMIESIKKITTLRKTVKISTVVTIATYERNMFSRQGKITFPKPPSRRRRASRRRRRASRRRREPPRGR